MKKLFAIFCAVCLIPSFSAQAWIGGPFSNNSYNGVGGEDGVYEAVATGIGAGSNTIGFYRIVIGNNFSGLSSQTPPNTSVITGNPSINGQSGSGNVVIGGIGNQTNTFWYSNGVSYAGRAFGSVQTNTTITGISTATEYDVTAPTAANTLTSFFSAPIQNNGSGLAARRFTGTGRFSRAGVNPITNATIIVVGSKVSSQILFGQ